MQHPSRRWMLAGACIDATHAATMLALAVARPNRRAPATTSATFALLIAVAEIRGSWRSQTQPLGAERHTIDHDTMTHPHPQPTRPSGRQIEITHADQRAWVVEVGGSLRAYQVGDHDVLDGYSADERCTAARGHSLIPWPNRLRDGRYRFADRDHQLPLTEPDKHNAIHGLTRWANWTPADHAANRVTMRHRLHPQPGYPFALDLEITYSLADDGLYVHTTATNIGTTPAPYGTGAPPLPRPRHADHRHRSTSRTRAGSGFPPTIAVSRPEQSPSPTRTMTSKRRA